MLDGRNFVNIYMKGKLYESIKDEDMSLDNFKFNFFSTKLMRGS